MERLIDWQHPRVQTLTFAAAAAAAAAVLAVFTLQRPGAGVGERPAVRQKRYIPSPTETLLPYVSTEQAATMAYPPNAMPGARDVPTPYGTMRVYEWGPEQGKKVVFVHGDATPSPVFSKIAQTLVNNGYRVLLFDLWGRGYSATPLGCKHDCRLFALQILFAVTSSPLSWTGDGTSFSLVAFSLGSPISLDFAATYPRMVDSLVLIGSAGLIRTWPSGYDGFFMHHPSWLPSTSYMRELVRLVLGVERTKPVQKSASPVSKATPLAEPASVERDFDMAGLCQWQFDHNEGHVYAFQDTIRYGPAFGHHHVWAKACDIIAGRSEEQSPLHNSRVLLFFGDDDTVVIGSETTEDIEKMLPSSHMDVRYLPGTHGFIYPNSDAIAASILEFWS